MNSRLPPQELLPSPQGWIAQKISDMQSDSPNVPSDVVNVVRITIPRIEASLRESGAEIECMSKLLLEAGLLPLKDFGGPLGGMLGML